MTNLERLTIAMGNRQYYTEAVYTQLLEENGLTATSTYDATANKEPLLRTELDILQSLANNIDYFRSIQTEFATTSEAYKNLASRINDIENQIAALPTYEPDKSQITYLYCN